MNGKERAEKRLSDLKEWQEVFYANAEIPAPSRQFKRWVRMYSEKRSAAEQAQIALRQRRQKPRQTA